MKQQLTAFTLLLLLFSCKHELEAPSWDTDWTAPLVHTELGLHQLELDSSILFDTLADNSLSLVYQQELFSYGFDSLINLGGASTIKNVKLDSIKFADTHILHEITLGEVVADIPLGNLLFPDGGSSIIPPSSNVYQDTVAIDANDYFEEMVLQEGFLDVTITNGFPTDLSNLQLALRNAGASSDIVWMNVPLLAVGSSITESVSLAGTTLFGNLEVEILNVDMVGTSTPVAIDHSDALSAEITIRDIVPLEGIAVFPEQQLFLEDTVVSFELDDAWLNKIIVAEGGVDLNAVSTVQDTLKIEYTIPGAIQNGQPFRLYMEVPPAPVGGSIEVNEFFDFSNYELDLTGKYGDTVNTLYTVSRGWIDSSGIKTHISLEDSIYTVITVRDIKPSAAWGYLGQDTITGTESVDVDAFNNFEGNFDLTRLSVSMLTKNFVGAAAKVHFPSFVASSNGVQMALSGTALEEALFIAPATENSQSVYVPVTPSTQVLLLTEENSNIDELLEAKPDQLKMSYELQLNPEANNEAGFIYLGKGIESELQVEVPLQFIAEGISLKDTAELSIETPEELEEASFTLLAENGYPLEASIKLTFLDEAEQTLDQLSQNNVIAAATLNGEGLVETAKTSVIKLPFNNSNGLLDNSKKLAFEITLNSKPNNEAIKLYSDYRMGLKLIGNFNYTIGN
jgi:hypothetical protein